MQTFILRFKFKGDKLITLGVGLHSNEEENFFNRIVKSELNKIVQGRHRNSARNSSFSSNSSKLSFKMAARSPVCRTPRKTLLQSPMLHRCAFLAFFQENHPA